MDNYVSVVFDDDRDAAAALHELWRLDGIGEITVHGAALLHRDKFGYVQVATKQTDPGLRTAIGVGVGALLGALAGPIGAAAGASVAAGAAAGIGAAAGGVVGLTADAVKSGEHEEAAYESGFVLRDGQSAVVAEVSEDWTEPIDTVMTRRGGTIFRRPKRDIRDASWDGGYPYYPYPYYLYPYDCDPYFHY